MAEVFLGVGTNLGDREQNVIKALREINKLGPLVRSRFYETTPIGMAPGTPEFLNCVFKVWTDASPRHVLDAALAAEAKLGRDPTCRRGSRIMDIDLLIHGDSVLQEPDLVLPHPRLQERAFVLMPLAELAPDLVHPVLKKTIAELLAALPAAGARPWPKD